MQLKFEAKSQRVKGLSFHPLRPWLLVSLHNGLIQLWDYRIQTLVETFDAHDGPCRGLDFHPTQPLFVSGGDDYLIKVWNYKQRKHQFTLQGHLDYIRTTFFHHELPWILSCSDDQTIRIWNYQSRSMLAILTGHSHYVMAAHFHKSKDLIVSCSLDQTLRLWDYSAIKNKSKQRSGNSEHFEVYGAEVDIIAIMEGHDRGVNYCAFHPSQNVILSCSDDRKVKLWKYTESKAWEHDTLFGHSNNVSSGFFHHSLDLIVTNGEDSNIRVWSLDRRSQFDFYKKDTDRYWICAGHPENILFAAGHDNGFQIFSLIKQKMFYSMMSQDQVIIVNKKKLEYASLQGKESVTLIDFDSQGELIYNAFIFQMNYNNFENSKVQLLLGIQNEQFKNNIEKTHILITYDSTNLQTAQYQKRTFNVQNAIFVTKNKIAKLNNNKEVEIYNLDLDSSSQPLPGLTGVSKIFQSPVGKLIAITEEQIVLYDVNGKKSVQTIQLNSELVNIKQIIWNKTNSFIAFVCKKQIHIYTKNLQKICSFSEKFNIKSLIWAKENTILYSTISHIKFGFLNGDSGIIKCTDQNLRIVSYNFAKSEIFLIDQSGKTQTGKINSEELLLKLALYEKNWEKTQKLLQNIPKLGNSVVSYLYKKNYAGLALNLVNDTRAQFSLALDSGNLEVAYKAAQELKDKDLYKQFAKEALRQGQMQVWESDPNVEMAYRQTKEYNKLQFLYLITGQQQKLNAINQIAQKRGDVQSRFQNSLYTGDIQERIKVLSEIGQIQLAYLTAVTHGQTEMAKILQGSIENPDQLQQELEEIQQLHNQVAMVPPQPLVRNIKTSLQAQRNWPLNYIPEEYMIAQKSSQDEKLQELVQQQQVNNILVEDEDIQNQDEDEKNENDKQDFQNFEANEDEGADANEWGLEDDELPPEEKVVEEEIKTIKKSQTQKQDIYKRQENIIIKNGKLSQNAGEQTSVGYFDLAFQTMKKQLGIVNYEPLKNVAMKIRTYSQVCVPHLPFLQSNIQFIQSENNRPYLFINISQLQALTTNAYKLFGKGPSKFKETHDTFLELLYSVPFILLKSQDEVKVIQQLIRICLEYIISIRLQLQAKKEPSRSSELLVYMAMCNLQTPHKEITLRQAQSILFKEKNFIYTAQIASKIVKLLENSSKQDVVNNSKRILSECEKQGTNVNKLNIEEGWLYDEDFVLSLDASTFKIIEGNSVKCPFCQARYNKSSEGQICNICRVAKIGQEVLGLKYIS